VSDVKFQCPHCGQTIDAPSEMRGQKCSCPACNSQLDVPRDWTPLRWIVPLACLTLPLWWDYDWWKSDHLFPEVDTLVLITPSAIWFLLAFWWMRKRDRGRAVTVLGCGIMAFGWWGLHSIPGVIFGAILFLCGLAAIIVEAIRTSKNSN
jgi:uncharacterized paraquat-inducible protein A